MRGGKPPTAILIAGPTASGKSALGIKLAQAHDGVIINADSMQVYGQLRIVTARPTNEEVAQCEHLLYGHRDARDAYDVALWVKEAREAYSNAIERGKVPIFVGGTGLYFKALVEGLFAMPEIDPDIRNKWREFGANKGDELHDQLQQRDIKAAELLRGSDHQRLMRALEVIDSTGKSILHWQKANKGEPVLGGDGVQKQVLMPERSQLHSRINGRFDQMIANGALEEVEAFLNLGISPALPATKAIGIRQLGAYLSGEILLEEAISKAKAASRQYAKRQSTWFNNQFEDDWERIGG